MYYFIIIKASFQDFLEAPLDAAKYCCKALHLAGLARIPGFVLSLSAGKVGNVASLFKEKLKDILLVLLLIESSKEVDFAVVNTDNLHCALISKSTYVGSPEHQLMSARWSSC